MSAAVPCILDIEASGFGAGHYPIEIGYAGADGSSWCSLIRPEAGWTAWDDGAEQVHGIARPTLQARGRPAAEVAQHLNAALRGQVVYSDGWAHDYPWLAQLYDAAGLVPSFRLESVQRLLSEAALARLDAQRRLAFASLGIERHRASSDARALQWAIGRARGDAQLF